MNLNQLSIPVSDLDKSIDFYTRLGHKLIVKARPRYARFECPTGNSTFSLHTTSPPSIGQGIMVYFEVTDLDSCVKELTAKGIVFDELAEDKPWLWREARLKDPDGHQLILFFAGKNRKYPPWRIEEK